MIFERPEIAGFIKHGDFHPETLSDETDDVSIVTKGDKVFLTSEFFGIMTENFVAVTNRFKRNNIDVIHRRDVDHSFLPIKIEP